MRKILLLGISVVALATFILAVSSADAQTIGDCKQLITHLLDRPDSGEDGNIWALDTMDRTVKICQTEPGYYYAVVEDDGKFAAIEGEKTPGAPGDDILPSGIVGTIHGGFTVNLTASPDWTTFDGDGLNNKTFHGSAPMSSSDWIASLFSDDQSANMDNWKWTYKTFCGDELNEEYVQSSDGYNGDIFGHQCPEPPTTTVPPTTAPSTTVLIPGPEGPAGPQGPQGPAGPTVIVPVAGPATPVVRTPSFTG